MASWTSKAVAHKRTFLLSGVPAYEWIPRRNSYCRCQGRRTFLEVGSQHLAWTWCSQPAGQPTYLAMFLSGEKQHKLMTQYHRMHDYAINLLRLFRCWEQKTGNGPAKWIYVHVQAFPILGNYPKVLTIIVLDLCSTVRQRWLHGQWRNVQDHQWWCQTTIHFNQLQFALKFLQFLLIQLKFQLLFFVIL